MLFMKSAILIINSHFRGLGGLVAMSLPLNPLKGTYKEFTQDVYNKKTDNENCCHEVIQLEEEYIEPPPKIGMKLESSFIEGMGKKNDKFIILLKVQEILTTEKLASVSKNLTVNNSDSLEEVLPT